MTRCKDERSDVLKPSVKITVTLHNSKKKPDALKINRKIVLFTTS